MASKRAKPYTSDEEKRKNDTAFKRRTGLTSKQSEDVVSRARRHIEATYQFERRNREEMEIDLQFVAGDQWPEAVKAARANRPMLTINQLPQFVAQVVNPIRTADIGIKVQGVDDVTDPKLAAIYDQLIDEIEYRSNAKQVYISATEHQVKCGIGWWRICTDYADDDGFNQEIYIEKILNPLSVYCDAGAVKPTKEDAMAIAVVEQWPKETFKNKWPKASSMDSVDVPSNSPSSGFNWATEDYVAVCEYWEKEPKTVTRAQLENGEVVDITDLGDDELEQLEAESPIVATREVETHQVVKYVVSGKEVLEKRVEWKGKHIPLVPVVGAETPLKQGYMRYGVVRFARDPQQLMNFYRTATAEAIALAPKTPWVVTDGMINKHQAEWNTLNQANRPYVRWTPDEKFPSLKPERPGAPDVPMALINEAQFAAEDMKRVTGIHDASLGARSNETSGRAIGMREAQGDTANAHFEDNLVNALTHTGRILIDLIPKIYDNERVVRLTNPQGKEEPVRINRVLYSFQGKPVLENDLSAAKFDVRVTVGKNFLSKRVEAVASMLEFAKTMPPNAQVLFLDLIVKNSDFPGAEELAKRLRSLVPPAALADPNDPNAPKPPDPMDDPNVVANLEKISAQIAEMQQRTRKTWAETQKTLAETDLLDGQIDQQFAGIPLMGNEAGPGPQQGQQQAAPKPPKGFQGGSMMLQ